MCVFSSPEPRPSVLADSVSDVSVDVGFLHQTAQRRTVSLSHLSSHLPLRGRCPLLSAGGFPLLTPVIGLLIKAAFCIFFNWFYPFPFLQKCYHFIFQRYRLEHYTVSSNWLALSAVAVFTGLSLSRSVALFRGAHTRALFFLLLASDMW